MSSTATWPPLTVGEVESNNNKSVWHGVRRWVCGESCGVAVAVAVMDSVGCDVDAVDDDVGVPESLAGAGQAGGAMAIASFSSRSRSRRASLLSII